MHISNHSSFRLKITVGCLTSTYPSIHVETPSRSRSVVWCVFVCACGVCTCGVVCVHVVLCGVWFVCVHAVLCVVLVVVCCFVVVVRVCVWCVVKLGTLSLSLSLVLSPSSSLSLSFSLLSLFFSLHFLFRFLLLLLLLLLLRHLNVIWCKASAQQSVLSLLPSPPQKTKEGTFYYMNISGDEFIFITVLNKFKKIAAGENYSHYSFFLIQKQKGCNCNDFVEDGILRIWF